MRRLFIALALLLFLAITALYVHRDKKLLVIAPTKYEEQLANRFGYACCFYPLPNLTSGHHDLDSILEQISSYVQAKRVDGILSCEDYAGAALSSMVCQERGFKGPTPLSVLTCQHKYYSRIAQKASVPEATPPFSAGLDVPFPCFVKPVKSSFSRYAQVANDEDSITMPEADFFKFFDQMIAHATPFEQNSERRLAEVLLRGDQVTWEGYAYEGKIETLGIVDSIMYPGTISFKQFQYPSKLDQDVQTRMEAICRKVLKQIGLDNTLCNIELMYDKESDKISIIEINPRIALQFCDLYEKVDGQNSYKVALDIAAGKPPTWKKKKGAHKVAASFVLRHFSDAIVAKVPSEDEVTSVYARYPDALIFIDYRPGQKLSDIVQDGTSYRYALIHLGGQNEEDLLAKYEDCRKSLTFSFTEA